MRLTFLGTGTSFGVPVVGCSCDTCSSDDPRDQRGRHGALLRWQGNSLLVDTPPELRLQLIREKVGRIHAVWYTHTHADHVHGIDDLRAFTVRGGEDVPAYVPRPLMGSLIRRFTYIFDDSIRPPRGTSKPRVRLLPVEEGDRVDVRGTSFQALAVPHGPMMVLGFRAGGLGYITDGKRLPDATLQALKGVHTLVLNALWFGNPHPTHFNVEEAVEAARAVGAKQTYLVHLTHRVSHRELLDRLPPDVQPAYDGLTVEVGAPTRDGSAERKDFPTADGMP
ncbi:MAG: MBL fold metallo-hydrolase [Gemmatimonadota bacterium]